MQKNSIEALHQIEILWYRKLVSFKPRPSFWRCSFQDPRGGDDLMR